MSNLTRRLGCFLLSILLMAGIAFIPISAEEADTLPESSVPGFTAGDGLSAEEYRARKLEYLDQIRSSADTQTPKTTITDNILSNEYIEFAVDPYCGRFTVGTTGGNPDLSSDDYRLMLFGHSEPGTSYTTIQVGDNTYVYGDYEFTTYPYFSNNSNISEATFENIRVKQVISIVENTSTMREDVVEIKYIVTNEGSSASSFGLRIMLDTMLGDNDAAPFRLPIIGDVTTEMEFYGDDIPQYWQAFDSLTDPDVVSYGNFVSGKIKPTKVQFTNWGRVFDTPWDYEIWEDWENGDSAVSVIWERTLAAGATETYVTRYGLSELLQDLQPPLGLTIASGSSIQIDTAKNEYMPYTITTYVQNVGDATALNAVCKFDLPDEMAFVDPNETGTVQLGDMEVGELITVEKTIYVKNAPSADTETQYSVTVSADNAESKTLSKDFTIEPLPGKKAIIIVPGIAGSRLYADEKINTETYLKDYANKFQSWPYNYFELEKGHMLWEPYTSTVSNMLESATTNQNKIQSEVMMLMCKEDGSSVIDISTNDPGTSVYGAQDTYKKLVKALVDTYGSEYEVRFFSYDWRMSNKDSAKSLETFINNNSYTDVTLVCHSMGGLVASEYLNRSEANQNRINKLITLGTPYLGAPKALYVFETGHFLDWASSTFCMATPLKLVSGNIYGIYQLLPDESYFDLNDTTYVKHYNNNGLWGKAITKRLGYDDTYRLLSQRSWAKKSSGGVKQMLSTADDFYDGLFLSDGSHIISTVDSYVVIGYGEDTIMEVVEEYNKDGSYEECRDVTELNGGDGTVPMISANIGGLSPDGRTYYIQEDHTGLAKNGDVISLVKNIINGNPNSFSSTITKTQPTTINSKGWFGTTNTKRIKIRLECPVTLSVLDENGEELAYVSENLILNEDDDNISVYVLGKNNDTKVAYLSEMANEILLTGTGEGTMNYTVSLMDAGYEIQRILFEDVPITDTSKFYTDTDIDTGIQLEVDEDSDGEIDYVIEPSEILYGTDLEAEIEEHYHTCEEPKFAWSEDYASCTVTFTCIDGDVVETVDCTVSSETIPATHTETGSAVYTATIEFGGETHTATVTVVLPQTDHSFVQGICSECGALFGDANRDGIVNNVDAMLVLQYYVGLAKADALDLSVCDLNSNGIIDNTDAMLILQHFVGILSWAE